MGKRTPLYESHVAAQAKMIDFAGWEMPLHYGSQLDEHHYIRQTAGVFDVSHMTIVDLAGQDATVYLKYLLANDVDKLIPGKALYTCMLNANGGVIDDLIVYKIAESNYRLVVNSATHDKDLAWIRQQADKFDITITEQPQLAMLAIQGPQIRALISALFTPEQTQTILNLKPFHFALVEQRFIARTGYTGEDGFELILSAADAVVFWQQLLALGVKPCGLGARDTLRLEAGLNLYGADMDENVTPLESNLAWTVAFEPADRQFIGRAVLEEQLKVGVKQQLVGLILDGQGVLRNHQKVIVEGLGEGEITSGSFSPTLGKGIALARIPAGTIGHCLIEMRGKNVPAQVIKPPFVRQGKKHLVT
jgi:aminomethyltransferase